MTVDNGGNRFRSQRERELDELRMKGLAKTRRTELNLNDLASPLTTPEQAQHFLATMRDKSKKHEVPHKPPTTLSADGVDAWYMMQRQREREMRKRRMEAAALLRGYRAGTQELDAFSPPSRTRTGRMSLGDSLSETLIDPNTPAKFDNTRRQSSMARLQLNWGHSEDGSEDSAIEDPLLRGRKSLAPDRADFLKGRRKYSGHSGDRGSNFHETRDQFMNGTFSSDDDIHEIDFERRQTFSQKKKSGTVAFEADCFEMNAFHEQAHLSTPRRQAEDDVRDAAPPIQQPATHIDTTPSEERLRKSGKKKSMDYRDDMSVQSHLFAQPPEKTSNAPMEEVPETIWRDFISSDPGARFPPESGRYHLYASYACPGSHRALIVRALKGLEDVISVTIVHPTWRHTNLDDTEDKHRGWVFGDPDGKPFRNTMGRGGPFPPAYDGNEPDPILNAYSVREIYEFAEDTSGKYTIPFLFDKVHNTIVNNESSDISYMLNSCFNDFSSNPGLDLYTEDDEDGLEKLNEVSEWLYPMMIHGVYRCGFAKTQRAYDMAIDELTAAFDMADDLLQTQRYLTGDTLTDADIRLFVTLLRFDEVYAFYFRANTRMVMMTPSLLNFCREIYQMNGVAKTCRMDQIKAHFFGSHAEWNKYSVIPRGLGFMRLMEEPHDRDFLQGQLTFE